jgi:hypothetical protein
MAEATVADIVEAAAARARARTLAAVRSAIEILEGECKATSGTPAHGVIQGGGRPEDARDPPEKG